MAAKPKPFVRKTPPFPLQVASSLFFAGVMRPVVWVLEKFGRAERMLSKAHPRQLKQIARKNPFRNYTPGPQDIFVMTYAKSGTNWMMQIAHQLIHHGKGEFDHLHEVVPWPDMEMMQSFMRRYAIPLKDADQWKNAPERKRVIKTHYNWDQLPYSPEARYIAVIRDPKDVFVSNYFFVRDSVFRKAMPSVDTWYKLFLSENFVLGGSWAVNAAGYWAQRQHPNVMVVSFKSMKTDLRGTVCKVAEFLNIHVGDEIIDEVCRRSAFESMKKIDHKFAPGKMSAWHKPGAMMRKGTQGGSAELLTLEQQREIDRYFNAELQRLGSNLPYEEFADLAR